MADVNGPGGVPGLSADKEQAVLEIRPHWIVWVGPAAAAGSGLLAILLLQREGGFTVFADWFFGLYAVAWAIAAINGAVTMWATRYVLTTRRLGIRWVLIGRRTRDIWLQKVNDVRLKQNLTGRVLGYGMLVAESSGERDQLILTMVPDVSRVYEVAGRLVEAAHREGNGELSVPYVRPS